MSVSIDVLARASRAPQVAVNPELDAALAGLDRTLAELAPQLAVEYYGPEVGVGKGRHVYRLVVRAHEWQIHQPTWSLRVCTALPHAGWRADWTIQGASRLRKQNIVRVLPEFLAGYAEAVRDAGKQDTDAGRTLRQLATLFAVPA